MKTETLVGIIVTIVVVALTIAVVFYLVSLKDKNRDE